MRKPEQRLWDQMRGALSGEFYLERNENVVGFGRPDVDVMHNGIVIPFELKAASRPTRPTTPALGKARGLNQNQLNWWLQWRRFGGVGCVLVKLGSDLYAVSSADTERINGFTSMDFEHYKTNWLRVAEYVRFCIHLLKTRPHAD